MKKTRFDILYEALKDIVDMGRFSPAIIKIMLDNLESILVWIESKEFKEKYANTSYPPLVNPTNIDYMQTAPVYAWDLNLPLPYVDVVFLRSHGSGATGMNAFLQKCGGIQVYCENFYGLDARGIYVDVYTKILEAKRRLKRGGGVNLSF